MAVASDKKADQQAEIQPQALVVSRTFPAMPAQVFAAWSSADHLKRWFCPAGFSVPQAQVEFAVGGRFDICMRSPQGQDHWSRGRYLEIVPHSRLVIEMNVVDEHEAPLFLAHTTVRFDGDAHGTRMEVTQRYTLFAPVAASMVGGAAAGWKQTLDRLEQEIARIKQAEPAERSVVHGSFRLERRYDASPARVFHALTDPVAKAKWFGSGGPLEIVAREMDVRPGGRELLKGRWGSGMVSTFDAVYHDVIPNRRLIYAYDLYLDERKISVSLATFELKPDGGGTHLVMSEHGAFLDGYDDAGSREHGSNALLDALGKALQA